MNRLRRHLLPIIAAALLVGSFSAVQLSGLVGNPTATTSGPSEYQVVARETACPVLQWRYSEHHSVWKAGVKAGHDRAVEANLAMMRAILKRLGSLQRSGRCGG